MASCRQSPGRLANIQEFTEQSIAKDDPVASVRDTEAEPRVFSRLALVFWVLN